MAAYESPNSIRASTASTSLCAFCSVVIQAKLYAHPIALVYPIALVLVDTFILKEMRIITLLFGKYACMLLLLPTEKHMHDCAVVYFF